MLRSPEILSATVGGKPAGQRAARMLQALGDELRYEGLEEGRLEVPILSFPFDPAWPLVQPGEKDFFLGALLSSSCVPRASACSDGDREPEVVPPGLGAEKPVEMEVAGEQVVRMGMSPPACANICLMFQGYCGGGGGLPESDHPVYSPDLSQTLTSLSSSLLPSTSAI